MPRILFLIVLIAGLTLPGRAQTVIDLKSGGVRAKTIDDYREESGIRERQRRDSLAYIDHLTRALNALYADSTAEAERRFHAALKARPEAPGNHIVHYYLGQIALTRNDRREAYDQFSAALKQNAAAHDARYGRAVCLYEGGNLPAALSDCEALLADTLPDDLRVRTLFLRSAVHTRNRQPAAARRDLEEILREEPENENASLLLACLFEDLGQPNEALNRLNLFLAAHPRNYDALMARAGVEERLSMDVPARSDYDEAIRLRPDDAQAYAGRARVLLRLDLKGAARKDLDTAVRLGFPRTALNDLYKKLKH